jgi:hypothetical protein
MRTLIFFMITLAVSLAACCDEENNNPVGGDEFFVFGHFYGECGGEGCVEIFKLEDGKLFEDTLDQYPNSTAPYVGAWIELPAAKYQDVKDIIEEIPAALYAESEVVLGQPDGGDWGGIYVQTIDPATNTARFWLLDKMETNMEAVYNEFVNEIEQRIELINQ